MPAETAPAELPCELLAWDSAFFGRRIARLGGGRLDPALLARAERWCREREVDCLYFLADAGDPATPPLAEEAGFRLVDVRLTLERDGPPAGMAGETVRPARPEDLPELRRIAAASHRETRFHRDPGFDPVRCDELYATWIERSCAGWADAVLVPELAGRPAGYATCQIEPGGAGRIGLFAVAEEARGQGLGTRLLAGALSWLESREAPRVSVVTQGANLAAQRLYQRAGFRSGELGLWFHRWFPREARR